MVYTSSLKFLPNTWHMASDVDSVSICQGMLTRSERRNHGCYIFYSAVEEMQGAENGTFLGCQRSLSILTPKLWSHTKSTHIIDNFAEL